MVLLVSGVGPEAGAADSSRAAQTAIVSSPLPSRKASGSNSLFETMPASHTGIDLVHRFPDHAPLALLQDQGAGAGVAVGDYDLDGWPDLFITHYDQGNRLYRNRGNWRFEDVTDRAGVSASGRWCGGTTFVDIDGDGDLDLQVCVLNGPNLLFVNQGNGSFVESARTHGLDFHGASVSMAFADYDRDGDLDAYLVTHRLPTGAGFRLPRSTAEAQRRGILRSRAGQVEVTPPFRESFQVWDKGQGRVELVIAGQADLLFRNEGKGRFTNRTDQAGIRGQDIGLAAAWWDYNEDGWPDLYVSNDYRGPDRLYRNNQDGSFTDTAAAVLPHTPWSSMGVDSADIDNDGHIDFMATDMAARTRARRIITGDNPEKERWFFFASHPKQYARNTLYLGTGLEHVIETAQLTGLDATDWTWSPKWADFDNDGWVDLFVANGMSRDFLHNDLAGRMKERDSPGWRAMPVLKQENLAFRNLGDLRFEPAGAPWGLNQITASFGAATGDLDRDGDLDLVVMNFGEPLSVYQNHETRNHRIVLRLRALGGNTAGIGTTVSVVTKSGRQVRCLGQSSGFMSASEPLLHFGLGSESTVEQLKVQWPDGSVESFAGLAADRSYSLTQSEGLTPSGSPPTTTPWFQPSRQAEGARHRERIFEDFAREPLLPWKLSQLGPGIAVGDVDGDGDEDFYLGGAAQQAGSLWLLSREGRWERQSMDCFEQDRECEDMGALFFDADADGDLDLFVVSGGVECEPGDAVLQDRLYWNDGRGGFKKAEEGVLPVERDSGSAVVASDFDRDGDLDLFIGGRCVPGKYPATPRSHLWQNNQGRFTDVTEIAAPGLRDTGLVSGAVWSDTDADGWLDLMIAQEWGPVQCYQNDRGRLVDRTREAGLESRLGWWNGIAARDFDGDGDIDFGVSNAGLNTPYPVSNVSPAVLLFGQFGEEAIPQILEAEWESGQLFPRRDRFTLAAVFPFLQERTPTFQSFANAPLTELFSPERLRSARKWEVNTAESGALINDGKARFKFVPFPRLAQSAPAYGIVATDLDADGITDLCLVQNSFSSRPETGRRAGGLGIVLRGVGGGRFTPVPPAMSGLVIPEDAKGMSATDWNQDGWPDLLIALNDGELRTLNHTGHSEHRPLRVILQGRRGNPTAIGARVRMTLNNGSTQTAEVQAGTGYLSQSSPALSFGVPKGLEPAGIEVTWPDGSMHSVRVQAGARQVIVAQKERTP